ncbi:MAG TPA: fatty acid desaturase [Candidatus Udaeobacter sp.]|nr:fatty acid desaturase [Candidatus Udaeobacter sp.]
MTADRPVTFTTSAGGIATSVNIGLAIGYTAIHLYQFFVLPLFLLPIDVRCAWTLVPLALLNNPFWSLIHEAIHDLFDPRRKFNLIFGRLLSIMFGSPFRILRLSHLLHHKLNRTPLEATEVYERGGRSVFVVACGYYFQILGGLYVAEFLSTLPFFLPRRWIRYLKDRFTKTESVTGILMQNWTQDEAIRENRIDGFFILAWFGLALICYGSYWPLLLAVMIARAFLISFLDNVYHYRTPVNDIFFASNLRLPKVLATSLLNFNFHGIHHKKPAIPWIYLPRAFRQERQTFHGNYFTAAARQLRGPVALQDLPGAR